MQWTGPIQTLSGHGVLFDPSAVSLTEPADAEALLAGAADGSILSWPAVGEEIIVTVILDEPLPQRLTSVAHAESEITLRIPSGTAVLADPVHLDRLDVDRRGDPADGATHRFSLPAGSYRAAAYLLDWPPRAVDAELRRTAGVLPVALRDGLAMGAFILGAVTVVGLPVFLIGRALEDGLAGVGEGITWAALVLAPLWVIVLLAWRLPSVRRADRADRAIAARYPDVAIHLVRPT